MAPKRVIGGCIGALSLFMAIQALAVDHLFTINAFPDELDKSMTHKVWCGWSRYQHEHGHAIRYFDAKDVTGVYWGKPGIAGRIWLAFMIMCVLSAFAAVEMSLVPSLKHLKGRAVLLFALSGLMGLIGASGAFTNDFHDGHSNRCVDDGIAGASIYLAFFFGWIFMWIAALVVYMDPDSSGHSDIWNKLIMKWSGSRIGGGIGAYCLLQLIVALSLDKLFFIGPNKGFKDHSGVGIGIQCGWSMYHQDDGYSMPYEDALSGKGWHTPEISGMLWLGFMLLAIFTAFCAVQISLTPALSNRKFSAMMLFIISGLSAIIGGATAHLDNHHPGHYNACIEKGNGSVSLYLAFSHAFGLLLAARFLYLDLKQMTQPVIYAINERPERSGQGVYNMETIELGDETAPSEVVLEEDVNLEMVDGRIKMTDLWVTTYANSDLQHYLQSTFEKKNISTVYQSKGH